MAMATATALTLAGMAGKVGAGVLQSRGNNRAMDAQERARREAMAWEREKQTRADAQQKHAWDQYNKAYQSYYSRYGEEAVKRYGVPVGITLPNQPQTSTSGTSLRDRLLPIAAQQPQPAAAPPATLGGMVGAPPPAQPQPTPGLQGGGTPAPMAPLPGQAPHAGPPAMLSPAPTGPQGGTLGSMTGWEDWNRYTES